MSHYHIERHIIKPTHHYYDELDKLCFLSKNLYNATLYAVRQHYFKTGKHLDYVHYLHQVSKQIVHHLVSNHIDTLVIGNNKGWKQDIDLGSRNNQNFVSIPFATFIHQLQYKCRLFGIEVVTNEEFYTSKCSFLDDEPIKKHQTYLGKRIKRGLFQTDSGKTINADVNGSLNILKKYLMKQEAWNEKIFSDLVEVSSMPFIQKVTPSF